MYLQLLSTSTDRLIPTQLEKAPARGDRNTDNGATHENKDSGCNLCKIAVYNGNEQQWIQRATELLRGLWREKSVKLN